MHAFVVAAGLAALLILAGCGPAPCGPGATDTASTQAPCGSGGGSGSGGPTEVGGAGGGGGGGGSPTGSGGGSGGGGTGLDSGGSGGGGSFVADGGSLDGSGGSTVLDRGASTSDVVIGLRFPAIADDARNGDWQWANALAIPAHVEAAAMSNTGRTQNQWVDLTLDPQSFRLSDSVRFSVTRGTYDIHVLITMADAVQYTASMRQWSLDFGEHTVSLLAAPAMADNQLRLVDVPNLQRWWPFSNWSWNSDDVGGFTVHTESRWRSFRVNPELGAHWVSLAYPPGLDFLQVYPYLSSTD